MEPGAWGFFLVEEEGVRGVLFLAWVQVRVRQAGWFHAFSWGHAGRDEFRNIFLPKTERTRPVRATSQLANPKSTSE